MSAAALIVTLHFAKVALGHALWVMLAVYAGMAANEHDNLRHARRSILWAIASVLCMAITVLLWTGSDLVAEVAGRS